MKRLLIALLTVIMLVSVCACTKDPGAKDGVLKIGMVCIGDENDQGYTYNFIRATETAKKALEDKGIKIEWVIKYNLIEGEPVAVANEELAEAGCAIVFNNSYGQEPAMLQVAGDYPEVQFVGMTNEGSWKDNLDNTHNAFNRIHEGRYVAGVVAGMKLQQLIDAGTIKPEEAVIGYVGAYSFAEVISGFTAYYLGAKSVCPTVTMKVSFVGSWSDATLEGQAAQSLIDAGCKLISQHSDNTTPATTAAQNNVFHTGYNADMISAAPTASIISTRIDWTNYFVYAISAVAEGKNFDADYSHGMKEGEVVMTTLNTDIAAPGTQEKMDEIIAKIKDGSLEVFDTSKFTVNGETVTSQLAIDKTGDFVPDEGEAISGGAFHESQVPGLMSAPYFALRIDGIEWLNEAF